MVQNESNENYKMITAITSDLHASPLNAKYFDSVNLALGSAHGHLIS